METKLSGFLTDPVWGGERERVKTNVKNSLGYWVLFLIKESIEGTGFEAIRRKER